MWCYGLSGAECWAHARCIGNRAQVEMKESLTASQPGEGH